MVWTTADESVRVIDISNYQRHPLTQAPPDAVELHNSGLDVRGVVLRAALWDDPVPDWLFYEAWDDFEAAGFDMMVYQVVRTDKDHKAQVDNLAEILQGAREGHSAKDRRPGVIWDDAERRDGQTTTRSRQAHQWYLEEAQAVFDWAEVGVYTAPHYWTEVLGYTEWARKWALWCAGYPYEDWEKRAQYRTFETFERAFAPNTSQWRPTLPLGWKDKAQEQLKGWQFSDQGEIAGITDFGLNPPRPRVDLNLFERAWYVQRFPDIGNGGAPDPGPSPSPTPIDVTQEIEAIRQAADDIERKAR